MDNMRQQGWTNNKQFKGTDSDKEWNTRQEDRGQVTEGFFCVIKMWSLFWGWWGVLKYVYKTEKIWQGLIWRQGRRREQNVVIKMEKNENQDYRWKGCLCRKYLIF